MMKKQQIQIYVFMYLEMHAHVHQMMFTNALDLNFLYVVITASVYC